MTKAEIIEDLRQAFLMIESKLSGSDFNDSDMHHIINNARISIDELEEINITGRGIIIIGAGEENREALQRLIKEKEINLPPPKEEIIFELTNPHVESPKYIIPESKKKSKKRKKNHIIPRFQ